MEVLERVKTRLVNEETLPSDTLVIEMVTTITDRLKLRLGAEKVPDAFNSIVVDAVVKMFRKQQFEGITSENTANISTSFVDDVLSEYAIEIDEYKNNRDKERIVKFL